MGKIRKTTIPFNPSSPHKGNNPSLPMKSYFNAYYFFYFYFSKQ